MSKEGQQMTEEMTTRDLVYLNEIGQIPLLDEEEEKALGEKSAAGTPPPDSGWQRET